MYGQEKYLYSVNVFTEQLELHIKDHDLCNYGTGMESVSHYILKYKKNKSYIVENYLMECKSFGTNPRMFRIILTIVEDLAIKIFIGIIARLFVHTIEFTLR